MILWLSVFIITLQWPFLNIHSFSSRPISLTDQNHFELLPCASVWQPQMIMCESLLDFKDLCCICLIFASCWKFLICLKSLYGSHSISLVSQLIFSVLFLLLVFSGMIRYQKINLQSGFKHSLLSSRCSSVRYL